MNIVQEVVDLSTDTGPMRVYVFRPTSAGDAKRVWPGLALYTEIFQVTDPMRRLAVQFAAQGHVVMAPEIYHAHEPPGTVLGYDDAGKDKGNAYKHQTEISAFDADARAVIAALKAHPACSGGIGVVGFCIGGHLAFRAGFNPEVCATCCFYPTDLHSGTLGTGKSADSLARVRDIRGELMMIWGRQDPHIPDEGRRIIYDALLKANTRFSWHEFNAEHAFMRDEGARYNAAIARGCLGLAFDFFKQALV